MPTIVAMGGGGFSMEPENPLLDRYVLGLARAARPRVCFAMPVTSAGYIERFYESFRRLPCEPSHVVLDPPNVADLRAHVLAQDVFYVGGGPTLALLRAWREHGLDRILREAWEAGVVLAGLSAGSICWFEEALTDSIPGTLTPMECLGFLAGSNCVHYDGEPERRPLYVKLVGEGKMRPGLAADDGAALRFEGGALAEVVSSRAAARAYRVERQGGAGVEMPIVPRFLGGSA